MKKIIVIFALLSVIFVPKLSFSQNDLSKKEKLFITQITKLELITRVLADNAKKLNNIEKDLIAIAEISTNSNQIINLTNTMASINNIGMIITNEIQFQAILKFIKNEYRLSYCNLRIEWIKTYINKQIKIYLNMIREQYAGIKNNAALHLIDKAKEIIQSSLELFDKSIETLKSIKEISK